MLTLPELLNQLQFITQENIILGLFITAGIILVGRDWRLLILTLLIQYILVGLALSHLVRPDIVALKLMIGAFICPILFLSARQVSTNLPSILPYMGYDQITNSSYKLLNRWRGFLIGENSQGQQSSAPTGFVFRLLTALFMALVATSLSKIFILPTLPPNIAVAVYWLILVGLTILIITKEPIKTGHGLLTIFAGFDLFYSALEHSLLLIGLWGAVNLMLALAIGYIIVIEGVGLEVELS